MKRALKVVGFLALCLTWAFVLVELVPRAIDRELEASASATAEVRLLVAEREPWRR